MKTLPLRLWHLGKPETAGHDGSNLSSDTHRPYMRIQNGFGR